MKSRIFARLLPLLCLFLSLNSIGQDQEKIDSLETALRNRNSVTKSIDVSLELFQSYRRTDTVIAVRYLNIAITESKKIDDTERLLTAYLAYSNYYWKKSNILKAKEFLALVKPRLSVVYNDDLLGKFYLEKGIVNHLEAQYAKAIESFLQAKGIYEKSQDTLAIAKCHTNIGGSYWEMNQTDEALNNYLIGIEILESMEHPDEASLSKKLGNIGLIYRQKNEYQKALVFYERSLVINRKLNMKMSEAINLQNIGALHAETNETEKALRYFNEAKRVAISIDDKIGVLYADHSIGIQYIKLGAYEKGINILKNNLLLAKRLKNNEEIKNLNKDISEAYEKIGSFKKALYYRRIFETWNDSLVNEAHLEKVKELELNFETAKKDKEIAVLTKENELQEAKSEKEATLRKALIGGILLLVIIGGLLFNTMRQRLRNQKLIASKNEEVNNAKLSEELQTLEMKALRAQMNPHFLFNCLNSINTMILNDEPDNASKYLSKFSKLVRLMLENSEQPEISLKDELETLEAYIQLESIRFNHKMEYKIEVDANIDQEATYLPSMVLQPFVENAIWHGLLHKDKKGRLTIAVNENTDNLLCSIIDNGVGREKSMTFRKQVGLKKKSMGIKITSERLKLLTKQKIKDVINIIDLKDKDNNPLGTQVNIQIPLA